MAFFTSMIGALSIQNLRTLEALSRLTNPNLTAKFNHKSGTRIMSPPFFIVRKNTSSMVQAL